MTTKNVKKVITIMLAAILIFAFGWITGHTAGYYDYQEDCIHNLINK